MRGNRSLIWNLLARKKNFMHNRGMKRVIYLAAFTVLGALLLFLAHALLEMAVLSFLLRDFDRYGLGLSWNQWYAFHQALGLALLIVGICLGYRWGVFWWQAIYVERRYKKWKWWPRSHA